MENNNNVFKKKVMKLAHDLKKMGYTVYTHKPYNHLSKAQKGYLSHHRQYFYVTNGSIILTISLDRVAWYVSCVYKPTTKNGSSCRLTDDYKWVLKKEEVASYFNNIKTEADLFKYNVNLNRKELKFYNSMDEWFNQYWDKETIIVL